MKLKEQVDEIIQSHIEGDYTPENFREDLRQGGCISGLVGELIYYTDTVKFFEDHKEEIFELALNEAEEMGCKFGAWLDSLNLPAAGDYTQFANNMAWWAFEHVALTETTEPEED